MQPPSPLIPPTLRADLPTYPHLLQLIRVTATTVVGPSGIAAGTTSVIAPLLYVASTQQHRTDNLLPRDREPCLAQDMNGFGLSPGYYLGRLSNSFQSLPVYEVICCPPVGLTSGSSSVPSGSSTPSGQQSKILTSLTPIQIAKLNNLTPCQLQIFVQLNESQMQNITTNLTATEIQNLIGNLTFTQLDPLVTVTSVPQKIVAANTYPQLYQDIFQYLTQTQANNLFSTLSNPQLSVITDLDGPQLQTFVQLTAAQQQTLTSNLTTPQLDNLIGTLTIAQLTPLITTLTTGQIQTLTTALTGPQIGQLVQVLTPSQIQPLITTLSSTQLNTLTSYNPATIYALVTGISYNNLATFLGFGGPPPSPVLGGQNFFPQMPVIVGQPSSTPTPIFAGYIPIVVDANTNQTWGYNPTNNTWKNLSAGSGSTTTNHLTTGGSAPTIAANAAAGTGASPVVNSTDSAGQITITTGTLGLATGSILTVTFATAFGAAPAVTLTPANSVTAPRASSVYVTSTATTFDILVTGALAGSTAYSWFYSVVGKPN